MKEFIFPLDFVLLPFYLLVIYLVAFRIRNRRYPPGHPLRPYFISGLTLKLGGALFIGCIYQYYYGAGDTANYFLQAKVMNSALADSPVKWAKLLFGIPSWYDGEYQEYITQFRWYTEGYWNSYAICSVTAVVMLFTFNTYLPAAMIFAVIAFTGIWALFRTFAERYPTILRYIAFATIYVPGVIVWGSGIFKDTICIFALGWLVFTSFRLFVNRRLSLAYILLLVLSFFLITLIKIYIIIGLVPAIALWVFLNYSYRIRDRMLRVMATFALVGVLFGLVAYAYISLGTELGNYSLENITQTSETTRRSLLDLSGESGSAYDLGEVDPSLGGMLSKAPAAVNVTLFRPYLWESHKVIILLSALESLIFLLVSIRVLVTVGPLRILRTIRTNPDVLMCLVFTLIFAFAVGISTYNFGTLSRYRIPCLPFYCLALVITYYRYKPEVLNILNPLQQPLSKRPGEELPPAIPAK